MLILRVSLLQLAVFWAAVLCAVSCRPVREPIRVLAEGDLIPLFEAAGRRFERHHPSLSVYPLRWEREKTQTASSADLVASPDLVRLEAFLRQQGLDRYVVFLGNELVLAARRGALEVNSRDWPNLVLSHSFGSPDPHADPAGVHAQIAWKLAEIHYARPGLYRSLLSRQSTSAGLDSELLSRELLAGRFDLAFLYGSTANRLNLQVVPLPPEVSLAEDSYRDFYSRAFLMLEGSDAEPVGAPIRYGLAVVQPRPNTESFYEFLLTRESQEAFRAMGYRPVTLQEVILPDR